MSCSDFTEQTETVLGEPVVFRRLTVAERRVIVGPGKTDVSAFGIIGRVAGGDLELWKLNGHWRENDAPHPRDLAISITIST